MLRAVRITLAGIVQGVGFRPFVRRSALKAGVSGYVVNLGGSEVLVHAEGEPEAVEFFIKILLGEKPPVAEIEEYRVEEVRPLGLRGFEIRRSGSRSLAPSMVPPDFAVCRDCLAEVRDPRDRRFGYVFNSCAYCGPRYSMMRAVPYDRENTSMAAFPLCDDCRREYGDTWNLRRYHAQGISCPACGPRAWLVDGDGEVVEADDPVAEAGRLVAEGRIVAVKGLGGFHLAALATDDEVVGELRRRKMRPRKPFAVMGIDTDALSKAVIITQRDRDVLESPQAPILLLPKREDSPLSPLVSPGLRHEGVFVAYTPLHYVLLRSVPGGLAIMTSGNLPGEPMVTGNEEALSRLRGVADYFLLHNRDIVNRVDDSVLRYAGSRLVFIRRGRGYAPRWIRLGRRLRRRVTALGAMLQNAGAIGFGDKIVPTQFIGDCDSLGALEDLEKYLRRLSGFYRHVPEVVVTDLHPSYPTTRIAEHVAEEAGAEVLRVQHHHAHAAAVMAEKGLDQAAAVTIDGVGFGDDGQVWGGEVLLVDTEGYERVGMLSYVPMPGGDAASMYPGRMLAGILSTFMAEEEVLELYEKRGLIGRMAYGEAEVVAAIRVARTSPRTSSLGRVLDAVSFLLGFSDRRTYEGEPAIVLEESSADSGPRLEPEIRARGGVREVDIPGFFQTLLETLQGEDVRRIGFSAQYWLGYALGRIAGEAGVRPLVVSGGAAVNTIILKGIEDGAGTTPLLPSQVPPGDGGIALGQAFLGGMEWGLRRR